MTVTALLILALLFSCSKSHEIVEPVPDIPEDPWKELCGDEPIRFRTCLGDEVTKTTAALEDLGGTDFHVFAFYQPGVIGSSTGAWTPLTWTSSFMYDQLVEYTDTDEDLAPDAWTYRPVKYWPNNAENTISFWAYSPHYDPPVDPEDPVMRLREYNVSSSYTNTTPGIPDVQFTTTPEADQDLMISDLVTNQSFRGGNPSDGVVPLVFHHVMCKVEFNVYKKEADAYNVYLNTLLIKDVFFTNVYNQDNGWRAGSGSTGDIIVYEHAANEAANLLSDAAALPRDPLELPEGGREILPIPQRLYEQSARLYVEYTIEPLSAPGTFIPLSCEYNLDNSHTRWEMNRRYTYNIHISLGSPILFTASVTPWQTDQEGYYVID